MAEWLSHRIDVACSDNKDLRSGLVRLDPAPPKTTIACPLLCGNTAVTIADMFTHLVDGVNGLPPCVKFDLEMETCNMCRKQHVAKDREEHWTVCPKSKRLDFEYQITVSQKQSQLPNFKPKMQFT
ncbi:hypothetical protein GGF32_007049 [Allomyces javanicus]|nr:hypothetical protein GGF32_007049 [Allomyces javanicus]